MPVFGLNGAGYLPLSTQDSPEFGRQISDRGLLGRLRNLAQCWVRQSDAAFSFLGSELSSLPMAVARFDLSSAGQVLPLPSDSQLRPVAVELVAQPVRVFLRPPVATQAAEVMDIFEEQPLPWFNLLTLSQLQQQIELFYLGVLNSLNANQSDYLSVKLPKDSEVMARSMEVASVMENFGRALSGNPVLLKSVDLQLDIRSALGRVFLDLNQETRLLKPESLSDLIRCFWQANRCLSAIGGLTAGASSGSHRSLLLEELKKLQAEISQLDDQAAHALWPYQSTAELIV